MSLLSYAIWGGHIDMVRYLLQEVGVDPTTGSPNHTPVIEALTMRNIAALEVGISACKDLCVPLDADAILSYAQRIGFGEAIPTLDKLIEPPDPVNLGGRVGLAIAKAKPKPPRYSVRRPQETPVRRKATGLYDHV
jgi:ankyrin repeat protein